MNTKTLRLQSMRNGLIFYVRKNGDETPPVVTFAGVRSVWGGVGVLVLSANWQRSSSEHHYTIFLPPA